MEKKVVVSSLMPPHYALRMRDKHGHDSLHVKGWIREKACLVTIDTGSSMTIPRPDITAGLPKGDQPMWCTLLMASGETLPILKETSQN
jgi:hypothetical protein